MFIGSMSCNDDEEFGGCPCSGGDQGPLYRACIYISDCSEAWSCSTNELLQTVYAATKYPVQAREDSIQGRVVVEFEIDVMGQAKNFRVQSDTLGHGIPEAAILGAMSLNELGFYPARKDCEPIEFTWTMPISFRLE
jgi:TonB family protein